MYFLTDVHAYNIVSKLGEGAYAKVYLIYVQEGMQKTLLMMKIVLQRFVLFASLSCLSS